MDSFDTISELLTTARGADIDKALKVKSGSTLLVQVGGGDEYATIGDLALNDDGSDRYDAQELAQMIRSEFPERIKTAAEWKARREFVRETGI